MNLSHSYEKQITTHNTMSIEHYDETIYPIAMILQGAVVEKGF